jgi:hypothetical protein
LFGPTKALQQALLSEQQHDSMSFCSLLSPTAAVAAVKTTEGVWLVAVPICHLIK